MPLEIKELIIRATVAVDWENKTVSAINDKEVCFKVPPDKEIISYVEKYFRKNKTKKISFDKPELSAFLIEWKNSLIS
jgi:predicted house-cleaning NTP pyrophosphatase (Maf/HAM1 superfamily)